MFHFVRVASGLRMPHNLVEQLGSGFGFCLELSIRGARKFVSNALILTTCRRTGIASAYSSASTKALPARSSRSAPAELVRIVHHHSPFTVTVMHGFTYTACL